MTRPISKSRADYLLGVIGHASLMAVFHMNAATHGDEDKCDACQMAAGFYSEVAGHYARLLIAGRGVHRPGGNCECSDCIEAVGLTLMVH